VLAAVKDEQRSAAGEALNKDVNDGSAPLFKDSAGRSDGLFQQPGITEGGEVHEPGAVWVTIQHLGRQP
jgi:hypothetical protein